jgi:hypothetical protein
VGYKIYPLYAYVKHTDPANKAWPKRHKRSRNIHWYILTKRQHSEHAECYECVFITVSDEGHCGDPQARSKHRG